MCLARICNSITKDQIALLVKKGSVYDWITNLRNEIFLWFIRIDSIEGKSLGCLLSGLWYRYLSKMLINFHIWISKIGTDGFLIVGERFNSANYFYIRNRFDLTAIIMRTRGLSFICLEE